MVLTSPASRAVRWQAGDDVLSSVLRSLRPRGHVFCRAELSAPWGLEFVAREFAHFHVVEEGSAWLRLKDQEAPRPVAQWDLVLIPPGGGHVLTDTPDTTPVPLGSLVKPREEGGHHELLRFGGGGHLTRLVCGSFRLGPPAGHPLLALMPPAVVVRGSAGKPPAWLAPVLDFLGDEARSNQPGAETVI